MVKDLLHIDYNRVHSVHISATQHLMTVVDQQQKLIVELIERLKKVEDRW